MTQNSFLMVAPQQSPLRLVVVGAGRMSRAWLRAIDAHPDTIVVGIVDVNVEFAHKAAAEVGHADLVVGDDLSDVAERAQAHAVVDVTVPEAHYAVTIEALLAGYPVLGEKPVASTVAEGLSLTAAAQLTGQLFMVSQSRRYNTHLHQTKALAATVGSAGILSVDFYRAPRFGGFRDEMEHPLLLDMAIHQFDMARYLLDADPIAVSCSEYNPSWSWYQGDASASAVFEMDNGARFLFNGSWCSPGHETSWNGEWRLSAESGTVLWDGDGQPNSDPIPDRTPEVVDPGRDVEGALRDFVRALRTGVEPMGRVHANVLSLAMVEAAIRSARSERRVTLDEILEESMRLAIAGEQNVRVRSVLESWKNVREALKGPS